MANIGGRDAGAITAACFLARFTKKPSPGRHRRHGLAERGQ
jgi:leucyl aminopeptidase